MKKVIERLLVFIIGLPAVYALVILLPYRNNLAMNIVTIFFSAMGAVEFSTMLEKKNIFISKIESFILGAVFPLTFTLAITFSSLGRYIPVLIMVCAMWILLSKVFSKSSEIEAITGQIIGKFALLAYPGLFISWLVLLSWLKNPAAILLFLFITFGNDSAAWLFGSLFGKNNKGVIPVSPNKSIAGFAGGIFGSVIVAVGASFIFPGLFAVIPPFVKISLSTVICRAVIIGVCTGIAASLGDLAESAIKRSCDFKDSGNFMLGRGGVLDSIDSIAFAAPVFFFLFLFLFS
jgi:phosphatidate cytidylyltransferase